MVFQIYHFKINSFCLRTDPSRGHIFIAKNNQSTHTRTPEGSYSLLLSLRDCAYNILCMVFSINM